MTEYAVVSIFTRMNALRQRRLELNLTQEELAAKADVDQATVSGLERDDSRRPMFDVAVRLARALMVAPEELFPVPDVAVPCPQDAPAVQ